MSVINVCCLLHFSNRYFICGIFNRVSEVTTGGEDEGEAAEVHFVDLSVLVKDRFTRYG